MTHRPPREYVVKRVNSSTRSWEYWVRGGIFSSRIEDAKRWKRVRYADRVSLVLRGAIVDIV